MARRPAFGGSPPGSSGTWDRWRKHVLAFTAIAPIAQFLGGTALLASHALPEPEPVRAAQPVNPSGDLEAWLARARPLLEKVGWTCITLGALTGGPLYILSGIRAGQPTWALGSTLATVTAPIIVVAPSAVVNGFLGLGVGLAVLGFGNTLKTGEDGKPLRRFDMTPVLEPEGTASTRWAHAAQGLRFIGEDLRQAAGRVAGVGKKLASPAHVAAGTQATVRELAAWLKDPRQETVPRLFQPGQFPNQVAGLAMIVGNTPLLFLNPASPVVTGASYLIATGLLAHSLSLFGMALSRDDPGSSRQERLLKRVMRVSVPLNCLSGLGWAADWGRALNALCGMPLSLYFREKHLRK